jgi:hypothetical protein
MKRKPSFGGAATNVSVTDVCVGVCGRLAHLHFVSSGDPSARTALLGAHQLASAHHLDT